MLPAAWFRKPPASYGSKGSWYDTNPFSMRNYKENPSKLPSMFDPPQIGWHFYHLESRWRNSNVLVYHGPLLIHLLGVAQTYFHYGVYDPSLFQAFQQKMKNETRSLQHSCWCLIVYSLFGERKGWPKNLSFVKHGLSISADGTLAFMEFCSKTMKNGKRVKTSELVCGNWW